MVLLGGTALAEKLLGQISQLSLAGNRSHSLTSHTHPGLATPKGKKTISPEEIRSMVAERWGAPPKDSGAVGLKTRRSINQAVFRDMKWKMERCGRRRLQTIFCGGL